MSMPRDNDSHDPLDDTKGKGANGNDERSHRGNESESNSSSASHDTQDGSKSVQDVGSVPKRVKVQDKTTAEGKETHSQEEDHAEMTNEEVKITDYQKKNEELRAKIKILEDENKQLRSEQSNKDMMLKKATDRVEVQKKMPAEGHKSKQQEHSQPDTPQKQDQPEKIPEMTGEEEKIIQYQADLEELRGKITTLENEKKSLQEELSHKEIQIIRLNQKTGRKNEGTNGTHWTGQSKFRDERPKSALPHGQHHFRIDPADSYKQIQEQGLQIQALMTEARDTKEECARLSNEKDALGAKVKKYENLLNSQKEEKNAAEKEILRLRKEKDELLNRLSKVASDKLTHENTDITDLSDENRPTKLAEKISELYDNQYTDAFDELKANKVEDKNATQLLLKILMDTHQLCKEVTLKRYQKLKKASSCFEISSLTDDKDKKDKTVINDDLCIELQQDIKRIWRESSKSLLKKARPIIGKRVAAQFDFPVLTMTQIHLYMKRCVDLCWMMNLQEKPMHLDISVQEKDGHRYFDSEKFRSYTKTGQYVAFVVWPALHLFEGGAMLKKGIAQGSSVAEGSSDQDASRVPPAGDEKS